MSTDSGKVQRNNSGIRQVLVFLLVVMAIGVPGYWLGGPVVGYFAFLLFGILFVAFFLGDKRRLCLVIYLLLAVGLLVGGLSYSRLNSEETAAQIGSLPLLGSLLGHTAVKTGLAVLAGVVGAALGVGLPLGLVIFISAEWMLALRKVYGLDRRLAVRLLLYLALGVGGPYFMVEEGEITKTKPEGPLAKFGAPVVAVVMPYNAVVLERSGQVTNIEGPGLVTLRRFERVKAVVDLRIQGQNFEMKALTQDNVPLAVTGFVMFRIEPWQEARDRGDKGDFETKGFTGVISGPYPVYRRTLYRAVYGVRSDKDWKSQTIGMVIGQVGAAIRNFRVDEIFVVDEDERVSMVQSALLDIVEQAKSGATESGRYWGVAVKGLNIIAIEMPEEAQKAFLARWREPWRGWGEVRKAEASLKKARFDSKAKAMVLEEQFERSLSTVLKHILSIQDEEMRTNAVLEVIRSLQPVDRRVLDLLLEGRSFPRLSPGAGAPDDKPEKPETGG